MAEDNWCHVYMDYQMQLELFQYILPCFSYRLFAENCNLHIVIK